MILSKHDLNIHPAIREMYNHESTVLLADPLSLRESLGMMLATPRRWPSVMTLLWPTYWRSADFDEIQPTLAKGAA